MTLLARRREEEQEPEPARRSVAARPPQPRPSFLHLQSAIGNRALGGLLEKGQQGLQGQQGLEASWLLRMLLVPGVPDLLLPRRFLVPDGAVPAPGQMTRGGFLAAMRDAARAAAEGGLAEIGRTAQGCPWIEHYFRFYQRQSAERIEADLRRYVPAAEGAASAEELLALAAGHVGESARHWAATGELTGVPRGLPGAGLVGALAGQLAAVQARLGEGRPLESATRSRMEQAFGARFDEVRVHTDEAAARLAREHGARAFALGPHVAFGQGEYRPGTLAGDAVLAHELAHTLQQRGATAEAGPAAPARSLEGEANTAAAGVLARLWAGAGALAGRFAGPPMPRLRGGLALARCQENFSDQELKTYLEHVRTAPERGVLGDNRARAVVRANREHPGTYPLSDDQVRNMIEDGSTGKDDQQAILELVKDSKAPRLQFLFTKGGLTSKRLLGKIKDERATELKAFLELHFEGGLKALEAGKVRAVPEADLEEIPFDPAKGESRGFRPEDLQRLQESGVALTFIGSLSPLSEDTQKVLLDNIAATVSFTLDPKNPDRIRAVEERRQEWEKNEQKRTPDEKKKRPHPFFDTPAERLDARDLYHAHVCVPQAVLDSDTHLQELRRDAGAYNNFGPATTIGTEIREAIGTEVAPITRPQARRAMAVAEKHRASFLKALAPLLEALKKEPTAGVNYHTWEKTAPYTMSSFDPIRNIFTPFSTNQPTLQREGHQDCASLINFSFHVNRSGQITLLPGASSEMVRAFEILHGWDEAPGGSTGGKP
jgi:hypothetical protein